MRALFINFQLLPITTLASSNVASKMENKIYYTVEIVPEFNRNIVERDKIDAPNTQKHGRSLSWFGTGTLIKSDRVK